MFSVNKYPPTKLCIKISFQILVAREPFKEIEHQRIDKKDKHTYLATVVVVCTRFKSEIPTTPLDYLFCCYSCLKKPFY